MDPKLLAFLKSPDSYPHNPEGVSHIQTHISHVFIASPYVYKFKKPVDFGFLDYSSLDKRKKFCHQEVELNRRLSDDIYLGVVSVIKKDDAFQISNEVLDSDSIVEYAVKMKQLPEEYFLHTYIENDKLRKVHLDRVAEKLANFYNGQHPTERVLQYGKIESIKVNTDENFEQTHDFVGETIEEYGYKAIQYFTNRYFKQRADLFERRVEQKRIVDGHGDLHLEHIHITPEKVQIYDCIEFNDRFRYGDIAADLAFLAMDLDFNNRWQEERYFVDQMTEKLDDHDLPEMIDFYKCYRAYVKGKVKSLQSREPEVPKEKREQVCQTARRYFDLSLRYALLGSQPKVLIFMGGVGTGKTTLARHFEEKLNIERFSSDRIRKSMAGLILQKRTPTEQREKLYSQLISEQTYQKLMDEMEKTLGNKRPVILDATFNSRKSRERLVNRLDKLNADYLFIETTAPETVIKERLRERDEKEGVVSDARIEDYKLLKDKYEPPLEIDKSRYVKVATDQPLQDTLLDLSRDLADKNIVSGNH
ncbi:AAA family ATPase [Fodinibius sp. SL11]|uniref:bifunctional aminoglycoside phosphotransferase/ATP-binding protein n=1 Tax=Fodinibius sp. SL11 TaxID=3425690 RepID=UPI003F88075A